jgi:hypothetical protein
LNAQVHALSETDYFAVAPNQRGYSAGARPDPTDHASYRVDHLVGDALHVVAAVGLVTTVSTSSAMTGVPASLVADRGSAPGAVGVADHPVPSAPAGVGTGAGITGR